MSAIPMTMPSAPVEPATATHAAATARSDADELARLAQDGSAASFSSLVGALEGRVYGFLLRRVRSSADAEDLTQETFVKAWRGLGRYDRTRPFSAWLFTIAARLSATHAEAAERRRAREASAAPRDADPRAAAIDRDGEPDVWALAESILTADQYAALWLRYVEDMQTSEIAAALGRTDGAVRVLLHRARERLAETLSGRTSDDAEIQA